MATLDPRVDDYIHTLPDWQQLICREVRAILHEADPDVVETIKRTNRPYFTLAGNVAAFQGTKDHVNVFLYDGGRTPDPEHVITGGHDNQTARTIAIHQGDPINREALLSIFRQVIADNRAGGWRRLNGTGRPQRSSLEP